MNHTYVLRQSDYRIAKRCERELFHSRNNSKKNNVNVQTKDGLIPLDEYTKKGTRRHAILQKIFSSGKLYNTEKAELQKMLEVFQNLASEIAVLAHLKKNGQVIHSEKIEWCVHKDYTISSTIDLYFVNHEKKYACIIDWKTGSPSALDKFQLLIYAGILVSNGTIPSNYSFDLKIIYFKDAFKNPWEVVVDKTVPVEYSLTSFKTALNELVQKTGKKTIEYMSSELSTTRNCQMCCYSAICRDNKYKQDLNQDANLEQFVI